VVEARPWATRALALAPVERGLLPPPVRLFAPLRAKFTPGRPVDRPGLSRPPTFET